MICNRCHLPNPNPQFKRCMRCRLKIAKAKAKLAQQRRSPR
jgi:hypothetical protein